MNEFTCQSITKVYASRQGPVAALENLSLHADLNEFLCIIGPSGCGKSTLLKIIAGIQNPTRGKLTFSRPAPSRSTRCAMVFQDHGLFPWLNILDNVAFGLETQKVPRKERAEKSLRWLDAMGLANFARHYPQELSGGMRQRAALGRAFLSHAPILLMDEPFSALDAQMRLNLQTELLQYWAERRQTIVYVTHDIDEAILLGDRVLTMSRRPGRILEEHKVPLSRPRKPQDITRPEVTRLKWRIWKILQKETPPRQP
jgi:NitT/TauT family transport system ATP-binding protein